MLPKEAIWTMKEDKSPVIWRQVVVLLWPALFSRNIMMVAPTIY